MKSIIANENELSGNVLFAFDIIQNHIEMSAFRFDKNWDIH